MKIWRVKLKASPKDGIYDDQLEFCQLNNIIGVGWSEVNTRTRDKSS